MRRIVELTDREIEIEREHGLNLRLREEGFDLADREHPVDRRAIEGGMRFTQTK